MVDDIRQGKGIYIYPDGTSYKGDWIDGNKHGKGKMVYPDGKSYKGDWFMDK